MYGPEAKARIKTEMDHAETARSSGNEGQARVCARRAAGVAIREFLICQHQSLQSTSATDLLQWVRSESALPAEMREIADHLLVRVTPEFRLPISVDLLDETRRFIETLEGIPCPPA